jgi:hypothetical protein
LILQSLNHGKFDNKLFTLANLIQNIREFIIDKFSLEDANRVVPGYEVSHLQRSSVLKENPEQTFVSNYSENNSKKEENMKIVQEKKYDQKDLDNAVSQKEQEVTAQFSETAATEKARGDTAEAKLAKKELEGKTELVADFVERVRSEGKIFTNEVEGVTNILMRVDDAEAFNFSEGGEKATNQKFIMDFIDNLKPRVPLGELKVKGGAESKDSANFGEANVSEDSRNLHDKAMAVAKKEGISFEDALEKVT